MNVIIMIIFVSALAACSDNQERANTANDNVNIPVAAETASISETMIVTVSAEKVDCVGVAPMKCLVVDGLLFYDTIQGFDFEEGYNYTLEIERTSSFSDHLVPADASLYQYTLLKTLYKGE